jgi:hypothetical protein
MPQGVDPGLWRRRVVFRLGSGLFHSCGSAAPKHPLEARVKARRDRLFPTLVGFSGSDRFFASGLDARVPKLYVQAIDLLNEHQNRATDCG